MASEEKQKLLRASVLTSSGQVISIILLFVSTAILARFVAPDVLGGFFIILAVSVFMETIVSLGLEPTLVKFLTSSNESEKNNIFSKLLTIRILTQVAISAFFILTVFFFEKEVGDWSDYKYVLLSLFNISSLRNFFNAALQANKQFKLLVLIQLSQTISKVLAYLIFGLMQSLDLFTLVLIENISIGMGFIFQIKSIKIKKTVKFHINKSDLRNFLSFAFPLYLNSFLHVFTSRINNFLIAYFVNLKEVANYEISRKIPDGLNRVTSSLTLTYYPFISDLISTGRTKEANDLLNRYLSYVFSLTAPVFLLFYLFRNEITVLFFGHTYQNVSFAILLLLVVYVFNFTSSLIGYTLVAAGKPDYSFSVNLLRSLISVSSSIPLIYLFGFMGAVYSLIISNILGIFISYLYLKKMFFQLYILRSLLPFSITFFIIFAIFLIQIFSPLSIFISLLIFIGYILVFSQKVEDFRIIYSRISSFLKEKYRIS